ncbi:MAG: hypothetical protein HC817_03765 [Saprospiraceae bacterium]|nr:hypothetical protein [Saprospiraceae bacterium]
MGLRPLSHAFSLILKYLARKAKDTEGVQSNKATKGVCIKETLFIFAIVR